MNASSEVVIIGGGLAGLCAAIHLSKLNHKVILIEKNSYPNHKVCGEYISNEVIPYLAFLGLNPFDFGATKINRLQVSQIDGRSLETILPLGGFGISRYTLDFELYKLAKKLKVELIQDTVTRIAYQQDEFVVQAKSETTITAKIAIMATGKRSNLDKSLSREFIQEKAPFLAIKWHAQGEFPEDLVALHNFNGGYCGVSKVEDRRINFCFITTYKSFKNYKDIPSFIHKEVSKNLHLKQLIAQTKQVINPPLSISQISFKSKPTIEQHAIMCGDAAGLIHPLCGNGMSMAIHGAKITSDYVHAFLTGKTSRSQMEQAYTKAWKREFASRLQTGRAAAYVFNNQTAMKAAYNVMYTFPDLLPWLIKRTHGKPLEID